MNMLKRTLFALASVILCLLFVLAIRYSKQQAKNTEKPKNAEIPQITTDCATQEQETTTEVETTTEAETQPVQKYIPIEATLTGYCPCTKCCGKNACGITASGTKATAGRTIGVDPNVIPYGTKVIIYGHTYVAEDCGGAVRGNHIDIFFDTHGEAVNFGYKTNVPVYVECDEAQQ